SASFMAGPPSGERRGRWGGDDVARPGVDANQYGRRFPVGGVAGPPRAARGRRVPPRLLRKYALSPLGDLLADVAGGPRHYPRPAPGRPPASTEIPAPPPETTPPSACRACP